MPNRPSTGSTWSEWIQPRRPDILAFLRGAALLLLPMACILSGAGVFVPVMVVTVSIGVGSAVAWGMLAWRHWWQQSALSTVLVLGVHAACGLNVWLVPRLDVLVRAHAIAGEAQAWMRAGGQGDPPAFDTGDGRGHWQREGDQVYTREPVRRWSPGGWRPAYWLIIDADGGTRLTRMPP